MGRPSFEDLFVTPTALSCFFLQCQRLLFDVLVFEGLFFFSTLTDRVGNVSQWSDQRMRSHGPEQLTSQTRSQYPAMPQVFPLHLRVDKAQHSRLLRVLHPLHSNRISFFL